MALVAFMLIVNSARAAARNRADRRAWSATGNGADSCATSCADTYSLDSPANPMPAMITVINHISRCHGIS